MERDDRYFATHDRHVGCTGHRSQSEVRSLSYQVGDRVRVWISDNTDPDSKYDGEVGRIEEVIQDDLSSVTGNQQDDFLFRVVLEDEDLGTMSFRHRDLTLED